MEMLNRAFEDAARFQEFMRLTESDNPTADANPRRFVPLEMAGNRATRRANAKQARREAKLSKALK